MNKQEILEFLRSNKEMLISRYGVSRIGLFGSYAKEEETKDSDIDFYVEFHNKSYKNLSELYLLLENKIGKRVDIVTKHKRLRDELKKNIRENIIYA